MAALPLHQSRMARIVLLDFVYVTLSHLVALHIGTKSMLHRIGTVSVLSPGVSIGPDFGPSASPNTWLVTYTAIAREKACRPQPWWYRSLKRIDA